MKATKKLGLRSAIKIISMIGIPNVFNALWYAWYRDRLERIKPMPAEHGPIFPSDIVNISRLPNGGRFRFVCGSGRIELGVNFLTPDIVQVSWGNANQPVPYAIARSDWEQVVLQHTVSKSVYCMKSSSLEVHILPDGGIRFINKSGKILREEMPPEFVESKSTHRALLDPDAAVYGLGERATSLNLRGGVYKMWNSDAGGSYGAGEDPLYTCIPVYMVVSPQASYLVFYENSSRALFSFGEIAEAFFEAGMLRYYFINGTPAQLVERFTDLSGKPSLPPRWALGYHQSRWGYKSEKDIRQLCQQFRLYDMPISAIHLDLDYMQGFRVFTINTKRFPNLNRLSKELDEQNIKLVTIIDPGVKKDQNYFMVQEGMKGKYFCLNVHGDPLVGVVWPGKTLFPDFTNPAAREWWSDKYRTLLDSGIAGFWHDMNEPTCFSAWGDTSLPTTTQHNFEGQGGDHLQGHNLYGLLMARAGYEGICKLRPNKRPWILTRAAWAGFQRYAWNWTGDIETSWEILRLSISMSLGLTLSGQPYSGPDIGGFSGDPTPELYTRWFQLASFLPFFRTHSAITSSPREPWRFGEPYTTIIRKFLKLRYRLLPYWYSLAWQANQTGEPLIKPLFWFSPSDPRYYNTDDSFVVGDALLVAPVCAQRAITRSITLPPGYWYNFWDDTLLKSSGEGINVSAPIEIMPIFAKAGKILPIQDGETLTLHLYMPVYTPSETSSSLDECALTLYSDAGDGFPTKPEDYRINKFYLHLENNSILIHREEIGEYPYPYRSTQLHIHGTMPSQIEVDGTTVTSQGKIINTGLFKEILLKLP